MTAQNLADPGPPDMDETAHGAKPRKEKKEEAFGEAFGRILFGEDFVKRSKRAQVRDEIRSILSDAFWMYAALVGIIGLTFGIMAMWSLVRAAQAVTL